MSLKAWVRWHCYFKSSPRLLCYAGGFLLGMWLVLVSLLHGWAGLTVDSSVLEVARLRPSWIDRVSKSAGDDWQTHLQIIPVLLDTPGVLERMGLSHPRPHALLALNTSRAPPMRPRITCIRTGWWPRHAICPPPGAEARLLDDLQLEQPSPRAQLLDAAFEQYPSALFVELGAGVGEQSVRAAVLGVRVVAVEAWWPAVARLHAAVWQEGTGPLVTLLWHAVAEQRTFVRVLSNPRDPSVPHISPLPPGRNPRAVVRGSRPKDVVTALTLDDLTTWTNTSSAILKMDIGGWECQAILGGQMFLQGRFIPFILMQWSAMIQQIHLGHTPCPSESIRRMVFALVSRGFSPYHAEDGTLLPTRSFGRWRADEILWKHYRARNILSRTLDELVAV